MRHCIIDTQTNKVVNIIDYASEITGTPDGMDNNFIAVKSNDGQIGAAYAAGEIINQVPIVTLPTYAELRAAEYPPVADYLDGVVKADQAQIDAYIAACQSVKAKYPKPINQGGL